MTGFHLFFYLFNYLIRYYRQNHGQFLKKIVSEVWLVFQCLYHSFRSVSYKMSVFTLKFSVSHKQCQCRHANFLALIWNLVCRLQKCGWFFVKAPVTNWVSKLVYIRINNWSYYWKGFQPMTSIVIFISLSVSYTFFTVCTSATFSRMKIPFVGQGFVHHRNGQRMSASPLDLTSLLWLRINKVIMLGNEPE